MVYDLTNRQGDYLSLNGAGWRRCFDAARAFGWKPAGTEPPEEEDAPEWRGQYFSNDNQRVTDEDARELAAALRRAIVSDAKNLNKPFVREFADYCEKGGFRIA